jgi:hypothetical protein
MKGEKILENATIREMARIISQSHVFLLHI